MIDCASRVVAVVTASGEVCSTDSAAVGAAVCSTGGVVDTVGLVCRAATSWPLLRETTAVDQIRQRPTRGSGIGTGVD